MLLSQPAPSFDDLVDQFPGLGAILWDLDGTILMTEVVHANAYKTIINQNDEDLDDSIDIAELEKKCMGQTDPRVFKELQQLGMLTKYDEKSFLEHKNLTMRSEITKWKTEDLLHTDLKNLIISAHKHGIKQAVVTSSERDTAEVLLEHVGLREYFQFTVAREDTEYNKPSPQPYLKAMADLGLKSNEVLIFEDSEVGLTAAKESQSHVIPARWYY